MGSQLSPLPPPSLPPPLSLPFSLPLQLGLGVWASNKQTWAKEPETAQRSGVRGPLWRPLDTG